MTLHGEEMQTTKNTFLESFFVRGDGNGGIQGAHVEYLEVIKDGDEELARKVLPPRPVALVPDALKPILGDVLAVALVANTALNEQAAALNAQIADAQAKVQRLTGERDKYQSRVAELDAEANALRAEIEALKAPKPILRVPTAALLIIMRRRGLREQLDAILAALPAEQGAEVQELLAMPYTRRDHPLVAMVQQAFGWTDAEVDALFAEADLV